MVRKEAEVFSPDHRGSVFYSFHILFGCQCMRTTPSSLRECQCAGILQSNPITVQELIAFLMYWEG